MILSLLSQIKQSSDSDQALIDGLVSHITKLTEAQQTHAKDLALERKEQAKHITTEDIHDGFDNKVPFPTLSSSRILPFFFRSTSHLNQIRLLSQSPPLPTNQRVVKRQLRSKSSTQSPSPSLRLTMATRTTTRKRNPSRNSHRPSSGSQISLSELTNNLGNSSNLTAMSLSPALQTPSSSPLSELNRTVDQLTRNNVSTNPFSSNTAINSVATAFVSFSKGTIIPFIPTLFLLLTSNTG
jgi:hypothetical protein